MKNSNKTLIQRFIIGAKLAYNTPILPDKVSTFNNYPLIRVFRVVGALSVFTVLTKKNIYYYFYLYNI